MVVPLILAIGGRVAISVILRAIAANRTRAIAKYGANAVSKAVKMGKNYKGKDKSVLQAIKKVTKIAPKVKTAVKATVKGPRGRIISKAKPKVKFKPTSAKQKAIQKKIKAKPSKKVTVAKPTKVKTKPSKKPTVAKPTKVKTKPSKKPTKKPDKKVTTATKPTKVKTKPSKKPTKKPDKKVTAKKPVTTVKPKPKFKPGFVTGTIVGGGLGLLPFLKKKFKAPPLKPGIDKDKEKIKPKIKPKPDAPRDKPGPQSGPTVRKKLEPRFLQVPPKSGPTIKKKFTEEREKSFEGRVKALVAQKDRLKRIEAGDGRSEYQVRMHKLKQEDKKAWKQLFTIGGKLK